MVIIENSVAYWVKALDSCYEIRAEVGGSNPGRFWQIFFFSTNIDRTLSTRQIDIPWLCDAQHKW